MKKLVVLGVLACVVGLSTVALADEKAPVGKAPAAKAGKDGKGYIYDFDDDGLLGGNLAAGGASVVARPVHRGSILLRPRTSFVTEMLKSVENL